MIRSIIIALLSVGIIGVGYWGYKEHEDKSSLLIHAENNYQRAFHELSYHMDMLHDKIGTSLAMNSSEKLSPQFVDIWKVSSEANGNVSELPLSLLPFQKSKEFLSNIGDFTYKTAVRNLDDDPLTDKEVKTLEKLYKQAGELKDDLRQVQHETLNNNLRWMDAELVLADEGEAEDQTLIDGFTKVEDKIDGFGKEHDGTDFGKEKQAANPENVTGEWKNEKEIKAYTKDLFSIDDNTDIVLSKSGKGADIPMFTVSYEDGKNVYMDITQQGAHPVNIIVNREINGQKLSLNDGLIEAEKYLKNFDYKGMEAIESQQYENTGIYTFVYTKDDVRFIPDQIKVKVALDNGEIIGLNARDYLMNHHDRKLEDPAISADEAKELVNEDLQIEEEHLAVISNDVEEELLVYELYGTKDNETYRVYINAEDGTEEKVEKLTGTETNFNARL